MINYRCKLPVCQRSSEWVQYEEEALPDMPGLLQVCAMFGVNGA